MLPIKVIHRADVLYFHVFKEAWMNQYRSKRGSGRLHSEPELIPKLIAARLYMG